MSVIARTLFIALLAGGPAAVTAERLPFHERPEGQAFIREMVNDYGFDETLAHDWLAGAVYQEPVIERISSPAERTLDWAQYQALFIRPERIEAGRAFLEAHEDAFRRAEEVYGVPREIIAAIIGVETWYGRYRGSHRVLDALATLAFDYPPRGSFFRRELVQFFLMAREQGLDPSGLTGSYAGAMGYGQFISSSYRAYAVDFDGDGVADIFENPADAIGSVGNYFREHRWQTGGPVADPLPDPVRVPDTLTRRELRPGYTVSEVRAAGLPVPDRIPDEEPARVITVTGEQGEEVWLTYQNFYVITRYNHSHLYAMAVHELARHLGFREGQELE